MTVDRFKRWVALVALAGVVVVVAGVLAGAGLLQRNASRGADPATAFTEVPDVAPDLAGTVRWEPVGTLQRRAVEPATRRAIEAAWTRAWRARQRAAAGDPSLLTGSFSGPALLQAQTAAGSGETSAQLRMGANHLAITFYSDDGAVIGLRAGPVRVEQVVVSEGQRHVLVTEESYEVALVLEDGVWRVRQWIRAGAAAVDPSLPRS